MDFAVGCDIEKISRFENKIDDKKFLDKIYTISEQEYCLSKGRPMQHLAVRYCAKEAVVKALSALGVKDIYYQDIEVLRSFDGTPSIKIVKASAADLQIRVSLSHCNDTAMAQVMIFKA